MTTVKQLYDLQELDDDIAHCHSLMSSVGRQLGDRSVLDDLLKELEVQEASVNQLRSQWRAQELDGETVKDKVRDVEGKLYGGQITNLRELEGYEKEATLLRGQLREQDDRLLEAMMALEEAQGKLHSLKELHRQTEEEWETRQAELAQQQKELGKKIKTLDAGRKGLVSHVGQSELKLYEGIRLSRGGQAIAKVERGMCRGCRMALPTHQLQRARQGREPVLCNSCGRILYIS